MIRACVLRALLTAGATAEVLVAAVEADEAAEVAAAAASASVTVSRDMSRLSRCHTCSPRRASMSVIALESLREKERARQRKHRALLRDRRDMSRARSLSLRSSYSSGEEDKKERERACEREKGCGEKGGVTSRHLRLVTTTSPLPGGHELSPGNYGKAEAAGLTSAQIEQSHTKFMANAKARGLLYADWHAAEETWLAREVEFLRGKGLLVERPKPRPQPGCVTQPVFDSTKLWPELVARFKEAGHGVAS